MRLSTWIRKANRERRTLRDTRGVRTGVWPQRGVQPVPVQLSPLVQLHGACPLLSPGVRERRLRVQNRIRGALDRLRSREPVRKLSEAGDKVQQCGSPIDSVRAHKWPTHRVIGGKGINEHRASHIRRVLCVPSVSS